MITNKAIIPYTPPVPPEEFIRNIAEQGTFNRAIPTREILDITNLPPEILPLCLSFLDKRNMQRTACVNKNWKNITIATASHNEFLSIQRFTQFLIENLNGVLLPAQTKTLVNILQNRTILGSINLLTVKSLFLDLKEQIINILKTLEDTTLNNLKIQSENIRIPNFEDIFELAEIYKKIDQAKAIPDENGRSFALRNISEALTQLGNIDKAIEIAKAIPDENGRSFALRNISEALTQLGNIDKAIEIANAIPNEMPRSFALRNISEALTQLGNIDKAIEIPNAIPNEMQRSFALRDISEALTQLGNIDKAIEIANAIPNEMQRSFTLRGISKALTQLGNIDKAIEIANAIPNEMQRSFALKWSP